MSNHIKFHADTPYPTITNATRNPHYVTQLLKLYSGSESELTAILQYMYQNAILSSNNKEVAYILEQIGIVEMHHLELLSEAIISFGGLPYYVNEKGAPYCATEVFYCTNLRHLLQKNLEDELNAVRAYTEIAKCVDNNSLSALLLRIAEDEQIHANILRCLLDDLNFDC